MTVITTILALLIIPIPLKQIQAGGYGIFSLFRKPRFFYKRTAMLFVTSLLFVGLYFTGRRFAYSLVFSATYFAFYALFSFVSVCAVISGKVKNPPVYTNRLTRLYVFSGLLVILSGVVALCLLHDHRFLLYAVCAPCAAVFATAIANAILNPFERLNNRRHVKKTKKELAGNDCLVKIAITGSFGKTTVKNVLFSMMSEKYETVKTEKNFNTPLGIAKSAKNISAETRAFIAEMGARRRGDIKILCDVVRPQYAIITGVTGQHLETFKTLDNVYAEKFSVLNYIPEDGFCIVNRRGIEREIDLPNNAFFVGGTGDFAYADEIKINSNGSNFCLYLDGKKYAAETRLLGRHNVDDIVLAAAMAKKLGVDERDIIRAIKNLKPVPHRLELIRNGRISIIDDTYNGNPVGAKRALEVLREFDGRRVVVTPGLVELGKREKEENEILGKEIANVANLALIIGRNGEYIGKGLIENGFPEENALFFKKLSDAERFFPDLFSANDAVLFLNDLPDELN